MLNFFETFFVYKVMWKNILEPGGSHEPLSCAIRKLPVFLNFNDFLTLI
jgi:hypothetical protein